MSFYGALETFGDATALIASEGRMSYAMLAQKADALYRPYNIQRALVMIAAQNDVLSVAAYLGALRAGHAVMMIDGDLDASLLQPLLDAYRPNMLFKEGTLDLLHHTPLRLHEALALLIPTSGTTGSPKMIRLSYRNLDANAVSILDYLQLTCNDVAITTLPLFYSFGLSILHTHLCVGASIVVTSESLMSRTFWEMCAAHGVSSFSGVPYHYEMLRRLGFDTLPSCVRTLTQAGGKMHETLVLELALWCAQTNRRLFVMYGQSEATARISYLHPARTLQKPSSIGRAIAGGSLEVIEGELVYRGDNVMQGYAQNAEDLAHGDELGGVLYTGDLGHRDEEGDFYITGRAKRFIKLSGLRIGLDEIEQFLKSHAIEAMCMGSDTALLIATCNDAQKAKTLVSQNFKLHHTLIHTRTLNTLPLTPSGKPDYKALS